MVRGAQTSCEVAVYFRTRRFRRRGRRGCYTNVLLCPRGGCGHWVNMMLGSWTGQALRFWSVAGQCSVGARDASALAGCSAGGGWERRKGLPDMAEAWRGFVQQSIMSTAADGWTWRARGAGVRKRSRGEAWVADYLGAFVHPTSHPCPPLATPPRGHLRTPPARPAFALSARLARRRGINSFSGVLGPSSGPSLATMSLLP